MSNHAAEWVLAAATNGVCDDVLALVVLGAAVLVVLVLDFGVVKAVFELGFELPEEALVFGTPVVVVNKLSSNGAT